MLTDTSKWTLSGLIVALSLPPPLNSMYRPNFNGRPGVRKTAECEAWQTETQWKWKASTQPMIPKGTSVCFEMTIYYGSHERDIDSSLKSTLDCLQGFAYENDKQIGELFVRKFQDKQNPRLEIRVTPMV